MSTPVFKRKNVRGTRRKRQDSESDDDQDLSVPESLKKPELTSKNASKWARYASLQPTGQDITNTELQASSNFKRDDEKNEYSFRNKTDGEDAPQVVEDFEAARKWNSQEPESNLAYQTLTVDNLEQAVKFSSLTGSGTFLLKESYFRDTPMEPISLKSEYADAFGNISEEDIPSSPQAQIEDDDDDDVDMYVSQPAPTFSRHNKFYDSEVSIDSEELGHDNCKLPHLESVLTDVQQRIERLEVSVKVRLERLKILEHNLQNAQDKRCLVLTRLESLKI